MALHEPPAIITNYLCIFAETFSDLRCHTELSLTVSGAGLKAVVLEKSRNKLTLIFQYRSGSPERLTAWGFFFFGQ